MTSLSFLLFSENTLQFVNELVNIRLSQFVLILFGWLQVPQNQKYLQLSNKLT